MPTSRTFTLLLQHQRYRDKRQLSLLALGVAVALLGRVRQGGVN